MIVVSLVVVVAIVGAVVLLGSGGLPSPKDLLSGATDASKAATCTPVQTTQPYSLPKVLPQGTDPSFDRDRAHIGPTDAVYPSPPQLSTYATTPPASGPHDPTPLGPGVYNAAPAIYQTIHSLEHGATIIWYSPSASGGDLQQLKDFYNQRLADENVGQSRVIVAPYDYPDQGSAGALPTGVQMALVAWHHFETCGQASLGAAFPFTARYSAPPYSGQRYLGNAPEAGSPI